MKRILFVFGTRPEAVKLAPVIKEFKKHGKQFKVGVCSTSQHREMLDQVLEHFSIQPDYDLKLMKPNQSLSELTSLGIKKLDKVFDAFKPDLVIVQGDTTTAFIGALSAYYRKIKVAHVEAGLRTNNKFSPFPEEINRALVGRLADYHFAPTVLAKQNLVREGITENVHVVGNTVVDALLLGLKAIEKTGDQCFQQYFEAIDLSRRILLVTGHRRENFGAPLRNICLGLKEIARLNPTVEIVYPVHLNPNVEHTVREILGGISNIHLLAPLGYSKFIWLLSKCHIVMTDSGGVQEEAPTLGKPILIMRDLTERMEGVTSGNAALAGRTVASIVDSVSLILGDKKIYKRMANAGNPYGDGKSSRRIKDILDAALKLNSVH